MPRESGASSIHRATGKAPSRLNSRRRILDRPPEFTIGPRFARTRWRAMTSRPVVSTCGRELHLSPAEVGCFRLRPLLDCPNSGKPEFGWERERAQRVVRFVEDSHYESALA